MTKKLSLSLGVRVTHKADKRHGLVVGPAQHGMGVDLIPVAVEGSTRKELWPKHLCNRRPRSQQLKAHGGDFSPPKGYPLTPG